MAMEFLDGLTLKEVVLPCARKPRDDPRIAAEDQISTKNEGGRGLPWSWCKEATFSPIFLSLAFIRRPNVDRRHLLFVQTQIYRELSTMVRHMIEYAITDGDITWPLADQLACRQHACRQHACRQHATWLFSRKSSVVFCSASPSPAETGFKLFQQIAPRFPFSAA